MTKRGAGTLVAYLWSTLFLYGCSAACASYSLAPVFREKSAVTAPVPVEKPSILLRVMPQVAHAPCEVRITFLVKDPGETLHCPHFRVDMGDGAVSHREQDCPPASVSAVGYSLNLKNHTYREGGTFVVTASVLVDGKIVLSESVRVLVVGPDDDPSMRAAIR